MVSSLNYDLRLAPLDFLSSGDVYGGALEETGLFGCYISSTAYGINNMYSLTFRYNNALHPAHNNWRYRGLSIRCLAR